MPAKITVKVELAQLLAKAQATTDANRRAQREKEADKQEDRKRLEAKKAKEDAAKKKALEDPVVRPLRTAAMGRPRKVRFSGYYMDVIELTEITRTLRSGVKATAPTAFYADVVDSVDYANQEDLIAFPRVSLDVSPTSLVNCPEYAAVLAEVGTVLGFITIFNFDQESEWFVGEGWYDWFLAPLGESFFRYYDSTGDLTKQRDVSQVSRTDPGFLQLVEDFAFTSYKSQDGTNLPPGKFVYVVGRRETQSYVAGTFTGEIYNFDAGVGFTTVPVTGGWAAASASVPATTGAWVVAESADVEATQSLVSTSAGGLNLDEAFAGDFSSWPGAGSGGTMIQLLPPDGGGGGGGGGE